MIPQKQLRTPAHVLHLGFQEKLECQERYWLLILTAGACFAKQVICPFIFILVQMHHTILEQFTHVKIPFWKSCASSPSSCLQTESRYVDLSGSMCAPRFPCVSAFFGCHTISWEYQYETVFFFLSSRIYLWLAETSQQPISQITWLKVTPHCNHCNHSASQPPDPHWSLSNFHSPGGMLCVSASKLGTAD